MKKIGKIGKRIIASIFIIYGFNIIMEPSNILIPFNFFTVISTGILGLPMIATIVITKLIFF